MKQKADGDEIDSMTTLVNELYERMVDLEKRGVMMDGGTPEAKTIQQSLRLSTIIPANTRETSRMKDMFEQVTMIREKVEKM